ncbi:hypothetical protein HME9302_01091 [Alteripontixanthobacter maritimus]|uniref:OmpA-like domain-containing protein n=1 Tax=Alteripontixanthobacter maritimus TaxID=2161824 RepID=A0A369Q592_9SPHN|nr:OmpA family protein [Alteripontixanthobacter maritimus]RDC59894.1 hypothetical protein HME9302_01091 [Alteripontixanthobacter maritimus]
MAFRKWIIAASAVPLLSLGACATTQPNDATLMASDFDLMSVERFNSVSARAVDTIYFAQGDSTLSSEGASMVRKAVDRIATMPSSNRIIVTGHASEEGDDDVNMRLSRDRAAAVAQRFVNAGVSRRDISILAFGEGAASAENTPARNRRATIYVY